MKNISINIPDNVNTRRDNASSGIELSTVNSAITSSDSRPLASSASHQPDSISLNESVFLDNDSTTSISKKDSQSHESAGASDSTDSAKDSDKTDKAGDNTEKKVEKKETFSNKYSNKKKALVHGSITGGVLLLGAVLAPFTGGMSLLGASFIGLFGGAAGMAMYGGSRHVIGGSESPEKTDPPVVQDEPEDIEEEPPTFTIPRAHYDKDLAALDDIDDDVIDEAPANDFYIPRAQYNPIGISNFVQDKEVISVEVIPREQALVEVVEKAEQASIDEVDIAEMKEAIANAPGDEVTKIALTNDATIYVDHKPVTDIVKKKWPTVETNYPRLSQGGLSGRSANTSAGVMNNVSGIKVQATHEAKAQDPMAGVDSSGVGGAKKSDNGSWTEVDAGQYIRTTEAGVQVQNSAAKAIKIDIDTGSVGGSALDQDGTWSAVKADGYVRTTEAGVTTKPIDSSTPSPVKAIKIDIETSEKVTAGEDPLVVDKLTAPSALNDEVELEPVSNPLSQAADGVRDAMMDLSEAILQDPALDMTAEAAETSKARDEDLTSSDDLISSQASSQSLTKSDEVEGTKKYKWDISYPEVYAVTTQSGRQQNARAGIMNNVKNFDQLRAEQAEHSVTNLLNRTPANLIIPRQSDAVVAQKAMMANFQSYKT